MKKILRLACVSLIFILIAHFAPLVFYDSLPLVDIVYAQLSDNKEIVACNGKIEQNSNEEVFMDVPVTPSKVYVAVGDVIKEGDIIAEINTEKTKSVLSNNYSWMIQNQETPKVGYDLDDIPQYITAPSDGVVTALNMRQGISTSADNPLAVISTNNKLKIYAEINENSISKVKIDQEVSITGAGFAGAEYKGTVTEISNVATQTTVGSTQQTVVGIIISIDNPDARLKPGFTAKNEIITSYDRNILTVPYEAALQDNDNVEYIYVFENGRAVRKNITTGRELSSGLEIISGLEIGERIIQNPEKVRKNNSFVRIDK